MLIRCTMQRILHLRQLAEWHRKWAEVAPNDGEREARLKFADYLDRRAEELELSNATKISN